MKKIIAMAMVLVVLFSGFALVQAKQDQSKNDKKIDKEYKIHEENGIHDVPGHPNMKVKVFVHKAKGGKPGKPTPTPTKEPDVCELSDENSSSAFVGPMGTILPANWEYTLNLNSVPSSVGSENLKTIVERAFSVFSEDSGVNFTRTKNKTTLNRARYDGKNIIAWGATSAGALATTYTTYYVSSGEVVDVDTIMNNQYPWSWADQAEYSGCAYSDSYDAQNIMTHEFGHWLGLEDFYTEDFVNHTMYGYGAPGEVKKDTLTLGDIAGIKAIYPNVP